MHPQPFFSIIIPCFNSAKSIRQAIGSIVNQQFVDFEIVIVDGVSTDKTVEVIQAYADLRIKIFSEPDLGIYDAMNKGIQLATGKWIYFLGSDDYLFDDLVLTDTYSLMASHRAKVVYGNVIIKGDAGWAKDGEIYAREFDYLKLLKRNICHQSIFYDRQFVVKNKLIFNLRYPISADWDFNFRCWSKSRFIYFDRVIAIFSSGGLSTSKGLVDPFLKERKKYYTLRMKLSDGLKNFRKYFGL